MKTVCFLGYHHNDFVATRALGHMMCGLYIQSKLEKVPPKSNFGLYRDNGLALLRNLNGQETKLGKTSSDYLKILVLASRLKLISKK